MSSYVFIVFYVSNVIYTFTLFPINGKINSILNYIRWLNELKK